MTSVKELCNTLRPGESISIDRSEEMITIRASLEGKVVFSNHVHLDLLDDARFDLIFRIILDSIAEVRQFRTEQEKVGQLVTLDLKGRQDVDELFAAYKDFQGQEAFRKAYREFREREGARRCLLDALTEEQIDRVFADWHGVQAELPSASTGE